MFKKILQRLGLFKSDTEKMDAEYRLLCTLIQPATTGFEIMALRKDSLSFRKKWGTNEKTKRLFELFDNRLRFVKLLMIKRGSRGNVEKEERKT